MMPPAMANVVLSVPTIGPTLDAGFFCNASEGRYIAPAIFTTRETRSGNNPETKPTHKSCAGKKMIENHCKYTAARPCIVPAARAHEIGTRFATMIEMAAIVMSIAVNKTSDP